MTVRVRDMLLLKLLNLASSSYRIVLHNQDNREHDLLDSDDYYQFQGRNDCCGTESLTGKNPEVYFGDNSQPTANP